MFKFWLYLALCVSLIYYNFESAHNPKLEILGEGEYCIYSREEINSSLITKKLETGIGYIYYCASSNADALRQCFTYIDGESITLNGISARKVLKKLNYHQVSSTDDGVMKICYGWSNWGKSYIKQGTSKINLQIAERNGITTVGWPVILGSY